MRWPTSCAARAGGHRWWSGTARWTRTNSSQVMLGFAQGEADVLLCTTIIESGLDIPNVNTIIIDRADTFGLAQLYQLRGRVGRGANRALCLPALQAAAHRDRAQAPARPSRRPPSWAPAFAWPCATWRFAAQARSWALEQHGHIAAIGFDLYCRLLQQAVQELRDASGEPLDVMHRERARESSRAREYPRAKQIEQPRARAPQHMALNNAALGFGPSIDLPISAYLPTELIADNALRLRLYRRMARLDSVQEVDDLAQEMEDRFGKLPDAVSDLLYLLRVRALASEAGVESVNADGEEVAIALPLPVLPEVAAKLSALAPGMRARGSRVWVKLQGDWRTTLLTVLGQLGRLIPTPVA